MQSSRGGRHQFVHSSQVVKSLSCPRRSRRLGLCVQIRLLNIAGVVLMTLSASLGQTPAGGSSGIEGVITVSPANPGPIRPDSPRSVPLANAAFAVESNNTEVASFTTDDQGHFQAWVPPGHYRVSLKGRKSSIGRFGPFEVDVASGKVTKVQWECDSGIR
jgi:hypothetical protein